MDVDPDKAAKLDFWRLCDELSVVHAALLIAGCLPEQFENVEAWSAFEQPTGYPAARAALRNAILSGSLSATVRRSAWDRGWDEEPADGEAYGKLQALVSEKGAADFEARRLLGAGRALIYRIEPDWHATTVQVPALREWLAMRGMRTGFFFPQAADAPDYLDPRHARFAPKLAAAVRAWLAVQDPQGKHLKQALAKWLREHSAEFGLSDDEGKPNEQGIEECAKVANWQPGGGAPKTPGT
jgi:hypothetical protein